MIINNGEHENERSYIYRRGKLNQMIYIRDEINNNRYKVIIANEQRHYY